MWRRPLLTFLSKLLVCCQWFQHQLATGDPSGEILVISNTPTFEFLSDSFYYAPPLVYRTHFLIDLEPRDGWHQAQIGGSLRCCDDASKCRGQSSRLLLIRLDRKYFFILMTAVTLLIYFLLLVDKTIRVWDTRSNTLKYILLGHKKPVTNISFSRSLGMLVCVFRWTDTCHNGS